MGLLPLTWSSWGVSGEVGRENKLHTVFSVDSGILVSLALLAEPFSRGGQERGSLPA